MFSFLERINYTKDIREKSAFAIGKILQNHLSLSEKGFQSLFANYLSQQPDIFSGGWYDPPPLGIAALFGDFHRLQFDTLRKEDFWPKDNYILDTDKLGIIYVSPFHKLTGTIGDFGITVYTGQNEKINLHLQQCIATLEQVAEHISVGMEFSEIHSYAQKLFKAHQLTNQRTITYADPLGTNLGHTVPWSYQQPTNEENQAIQKKDFKQLIEFIRTKRVYINQREKFKIPETIAFTLEARLESLRYPELPNAFYHLMVIFEKGKKTIVENFQPVFKSMKMKIKTKY